VHVVAALVPEGDARPQPPDYLNQVALFKSTHNPNELYAFIQKVEDAEGHPRGAGVVWPDRNLDVDIVFGWEFGNGSELALAWGGECGDGAGVGDVQVPHKQFAKRGFLHRMILDELKMPQACVDSLCFFLESNGT
jgi:2-amino-4-hydroxy-6-hydroxymethyldihydropteridine diphosphokinase